MASRKANVAGVATELQRIRGIGWPANSKKDRLRWAESVLNVPNKSAGVKLSKWQKYDLERVGISSRANGGFEVGADVLRCYGTAVVYNLVYYAYELISGNNDDVDIRRTSEHAKLQQQYRRPARQHSQPFLSAARRWARQRMEHITKELEHATGNKRDSLRQTRRIYSIQLCARG